MLVTSVGRFGGSGMGVAHIDAASSTDASARLNLSCMMMALAACISAACSLRVLCLPACPPMSFCGAQNLLRIAVLFRAQTGKVRDKESGLVFYVQWDIAFSQALFSICSWRYGRISSTQMSNELYLRHVEGANSCLSQVHCPAHPSDAAARIL